MKRFVKLAGLIALVAAIGFSMAACSGSGSPADESSSGGGGGGGDTTVNFTVGTFERTVTPESSSIIYRDTVTFTGGPLSGSVSGVFQNRATSAFNPSNGTWSRPNATTTIINISWNGGSSLPSMFAIQGNNIQSGGVASDIWYRQ